MRYAWHGLTALCLLMAVPTVSAGPVTPADTALPEWRYTLRPGDTLIGLCQRYLVRPGDWPRVQRLNRIADPYRLLPGSTLRIPLAWLKQTPAPATVVAVSGRATVTLPGETERAVRSGEPLHAGAQLATAGDSSVTLRFADGSTLILQPNTQLALDTVSVYAGGGMADTRLRLQQGRAEVSANPRRAPGSRLQIITPSAVAAVRGTHFRVGADPDVTREETLEGRVALDAAGHSVAVEAGRGTLAEKGKPPQSPVALLPAPDLSALPSRLDALPLAFDLPVSPGAMRWIGQIAPDAHFEQVLLERESDTPRLRFADLPDGDYLLRVRATDGHGLQGRDALHVFSVDARPFPPLPTGPGKRVRQATPELKWSAVVGSDAYRLQLARAADFAAPLADERSAATQWKVPQPLDPGDYYWRVASMADGDVGPFSVPQHFVYDPLPGAPAIDDTAPVFAGGALALTLPLPPAGLRYELQLAPDAGQTRVLWQGESRDGAMRAAPVAAEPVYLAARLVEADGTAGPFAVRRLDPPPPSRWPLLLLLVPFLVP